MNLCFIVNPNAGKKKGVFLAENAVELLKERGHTTELRVSSGPGDTRTLAADLDTGPFDGVVAVGGDGTLFEVINGLLTGRNEIPVPVGQIPVGTGNSFIKDLGIDTLDDAVEKISGGAVRDIDLGHFTCGDGEYFFINLLGAGFVSNVAYRAKKYKWLGSLSYILGVLEELVALKPCRCELTIDGVLYERDLIFVEICNSRLTGGNMIMSPGAKIDDGLLDIMVLNPVRRGKLLKLFPKIYDGSHIDDEDVEVFTGKEIKLETAFPLALTPDGETFGTTPIDVEMSAIKVPMFG
ncbi:MAG: diacylglycerol kinase family lipid kinase [Spirochaetales bacterium]|jgi:diacylglycerol kinase (ATP)|nr:diacylglycerol kinase family lipid kinase [Spirochaetales bacterium]